VLTPDHSGCGLGCTRFTGTLAAVEEHDCAHWLHNLLPEGVLACVHMYILYVCVYICVCVCDTVCARIIPKL